MHMQIALALDEQERAFMAEGGLTSKDYLKFAAEESGNVANDGMFSIQVGDLGGEGEEQVRMSFCRTSPSTAPIDPGLATMHDVFLPSLFVTYAPFS